MLVAAIAAAAWLIEQRGESAPVEAAAPVAATTAPVSPDPGLAALATGIGAAAESELYAATQLLARWQVGSNEASVRDASRCPPTIAPGLHCLRGRASLEQVLRFDRPLILVLADGEARAHALLQGAGRDRVRLDLAGETIELPRADLARHWSGDFIAVWRAPASIAGHLRRGDAGPAVAWVKDRLHRLDGGAAGEVGPAFFEPSTLWQAATRLRHPGRWHHRPGNPVRPVRARRSRPAPDPEHRVVHVADPRSPEEIRTAAPARRDAGSRHADRGDAAAAQPAAMAGGYRARPPSAAGCAANRPRMPALVQAPSTAPANAPPPWPPPATTAPAADPGFTCRYAKASTQAPAAERVTSQAATCQPVSKVPADANAGLPASVREKLRAASWWWPTRPC